MLIANILGVLGFLYLLWKKLKDDYHYEKVFNFGVIILLSIAIGVIVKNIWLVDYWFWIITSFIILGFSFCVIKLKFKFFESFDALVISLLPWISVVYLALAVTKSSLISFLLFWISLISIFLYFFFDTHYKRYSWYKSGRVGFSGLLVTAFYFIARSVVLFSSLVDVCISGAFAFTFLLLLYVLGRTKV